MNQLKYNDAGGFPLTTNRLDDIQETYTPIVNGIGAMAGNLAIISGCIESGSMVSGGIVQIENETFEFRGGIKQTTVTLFEEKTEKEFENGKEKVVIIKRYITFGSGTQNYKWTDFKRIPPLNELLDFMKETREEITLLKAQNAPLSQGDGLVFFDNTADKVPPGYDEVSESEWRGRIPVHVNRQEEALNEVGKIVGHLSRTTTISVDNFPSSGVSVEVFQPDGTRYRKQGDGNSSEAANSRRTITILKGKGEALDVSPPLRVVLFIKWVGLGKGMNG